ncbi:hypothetical protein GGF46_000116 [Coemansia sp. RSA 552]|nr:hypothetical protein GGF46_000116 [Coemansia sp. RSA 552]
MGHTGLVPQLPPNIPLLKSCESCRQRKIKCSGEKPTCAHCARRNQPCIYRRSARYKRRLNGQGSGPADSDSAQGAAVPDQGPVRTGNGAVPAMSVSVSAPTAAFSAAAAAAAIGPGGQIPAKRSAEENLPLAALFGTAPMDESEILPPSILQNMNLWMNDSLLTAAAAAAGAGAGGPGLGFTNTTAPSSSMQLPAASAAQAQQAQSGLQLQSMDSSASSLNSFIPMDLALGLPALGGQFTSATDTGSAFASPPTALDGYRALPGFGAPLSMGAPVRQIGQAPEFLQNLNQQLNQLQATAGMNGSYPATSIHSPLSVASPNPLLGSTDVGTFAAFPTSAFASMNLVNAMDASGSMQNSTPATISELLAATSTASPVPFNVGALPSGHMQPVPKPMSAAATLDSSAWQLHARHSPGDSESDRFARHNTIPLSQGRRASAAVTGDTRGNNALGKNARVQPSGGTTSPAAGAANGSISQGLAALKIPALPSTDGDEKKSAMVIDGGGGGGGSDAAKPLARRVGSVDGGVAASESPRPWLEHVVQSPGSPRSNASSGSIAQMNNDNIPQMIRDAAANHPELGSAELLYNLLITLAVHDCSRIGMYNAHLFWMRVKQYRLPKFHLFASIADATRSWTLPDELRAALPPNLDEVCYALAIKNAPVDETSPNVLNAVGLLILAAYEFKSARFAPMVEHTCLAHKILIHIKFRGAPFPWRGAKKRPDAEGLDSNYQLLVRAFWRLSMALYYSTEIFRLDAPDDREFLPEFPCRDDFFIQHVFVPDEAGEFGFRAVRPPYQVHDAVEGDLMNIICELVIKQYKIANRFNRVLRNEKPSMWYITYLLEWDRQMLEWRNNLPAYLRYDLEALARATQPLSAHRRRMNLWGLSEDEMWQKRHQWNQDVGYTMEVLYVHMMFEMSRIKAHRIGLMMLLHEDLDMVRNFQYSKAFTIQELPRLANTTPILGTYEEDRELFHYLADSTNKAASRLYDMLKFNYQFGLDLHAYGTGIISTLLQVSLVYVGQVQSGDTRLAWNAMLRLARILGMIRSLDRWGPALYIFTNILKALGRPELVLQVPSPETRAELVADTRRPAAFPTGRATSVDSAATGESTNCMDSCCQSPVSASVDGVPGHRGSTASSKGKGKRKITCDDVHGDEKRYEFSDHHHGDPHSVSTPTGSPASDDEDVTNPFPPDHVISHIMREQKVSTATFFSPTLPVLAASLLHTNST